METNEPTAVVSGELISELARQVVVAAAPAELPLFRATSAAYLHDPESVLAPHGKDDEILGFGVEAAVVLIAPAALQAARSVLEFLVAQVSEATQSETSDQIRRRVHGLFNRDSAEQPGGIALSRAELARVREIAFDAGRQARLPEREANMVADAMVGRLALA